MATYTPPPPPGLEGVFDHPGTTATAESAARSMTDLVEEMGAPQSTSEVFALEMVRRMQGQVDENGELKDTTRLANALKNAVNWVADQHGEMTANSLMASVLGSTGEAASEQSVSNGLVRALKLVDQSFGVKAGDEAIAQFNGELNNALNDYFDNGLDEKFLVVGSSAGTSGVSINAASLSGRYARQAVEANTETQSEQSLTEKMLKDLTEEMDEQYEDVTDPEAMAKAKVKKALNAYGVIVAPEPTLLSASA